MKRSIIYFCIGLLSGAIIVCGICFYFWRISYVGVFSVNDYASEIERFPSDVILGSANSSTEARKKAEMLLCENGGIFLSERPLVVSYDCENDIWLIQTHLPRNSLGRTRFVILRAADGKVLAFWGVK